ncbi:MAG: antitoxin MazE-like protein [Rhodothermales bacterium]
MWIFAALPFLRNLAAECRRQAALVAQADQLHTDLSDFMDAALTDLDEWK